jgi:hypothetical protein
VRHKIMPYITSGRMESLLAGTVAVPGLLAWQLVRLALDTLAWLFKRSHTRPLPSSPACMITGCDSGIGRETAITLAAEARTCCWSAKLGCNSIGTLQTLLLLLLLLSCICKCYYA